MTVAHLIQTHWETLLGVLADTVATAFPVGVVRASWPVDDIHLEQQKLYKFTRIARVQDTLHTCSRQGILLIVALSDSIR